MICTTTGLRVKKQTGLQMKKIVYVDMDNVLVDFRSGMKRVDDDMLEKFGNDPDDIPGIFSLMDPIEDAIESYAWLADRFDTYILSTAPWNNPSAWSDKLQWVKKYIGKNAHKRLIISHRKHLNKGHYLIDDRHDRNGADEFEGELIHFGSADFPDWGSVIRYLEVKEF